MACYEIFAALKDGDTALAREKQERLKLAAQRRGRRAWRPGREVRHGPGRLTRRPRGAFAVPAVERRTENRDREVDAGIKS